MRLVSTKLLNEYNSAQKSHGYWPSARLGRSKKRGNTQDAEEAMHNRLESNHIYTNSTYGIQQPC